MYNQGVLCPLFYQIGHTNPTPVLDGTLCYRVTEFVNCVAFSVNDGNITTSTTSIAFADSDLPIAQIYSSAALYDSTRN